jgi:hypothetical protein
MNCVTLHLVGYILEDLKLISHQRKKPEKYLLKPVFLTFFNVNTVHGKVIKDYKLKITQLGPRFTVYFPLITDSENFNFSAEKQKFCYFRSLFITFVFQTELHLIYTQLIK